MRKRHREANPIDVIEAAYNLDGTPREWLRRVATAVRPLLDGGRGMLVYTYNAWTRPEELHVDPLLFDMDVAEIPDLQSWVHANPEFARYVFFRCDGLLAMRELCRRAGLQDLAKEMPPLVEHYTRWGVKDYVALQPVEPGGRGVVLAAGQAKVRTFDARTRRLWARVSTHIAAGRRLRDALDRASPADEAVLDASGKLHHAEGEGTAKPAREALRDAVLRVETARGKQRTRDPEAATEAWTAMVSGRWSLVDRFERGGRRYIVARRNEHTLSDPRALTLRERAIAHLAVRGKSNKLIGYELGLSESTIGSHLSQAMRKLGAKSRVELIQLLAELQQAEQ